MIRRSKAREVALQLLYQRDLNPHVPRKHIEGFVTDRLATDILRGYCLALYDGTIVHQNDIDRRLSEAADNWKLPRMAAVDRNVLRLGAFELLHGPEPAKVVLDEWIELARRFGGVASPAFVNGILDRVNRAATPAL
jgi:N utilization substance protein B